MFRVLRNLGLLRGTRRSNTGRRRPARKASGYRPGVLDLESRTLLSTVTWLQAVSGDWDTAANWAGGRLPNSGDDVVIPFAGIQVTHDRPGFNDVVRSLHSEAAIEMSAGRLTVANGSPSQINDQFTVLGGGTLSLMNITLNGRGALVDSGIVNIAGSTVNVSVDNESLLTITASAINNTSGRPFVSGTSAFLHVTGGDLSIQSSFANGFTNSARILVEADLVVSSGTLVNAPLASITLAGAIRANLDNQGTIQGLGQLGRFAGTVTNEGAIIAGPPSSTFNNRITIFQSAFTNSGSVNIADSNSAFSVLGGTLENDGSISGPGTLFLQGITTSFTSDRAPAVAAISALDCTITSSGTLTNLIAISGSTINADVLAQRNLSVFGSLSFGFGDVGDTTINGNLTIGSGATVSIAGGVDQEETLTVTQDVTNSGVISLTGGDGFTPTSSTLTVGGTLLNQPSGRITTVGAVWEGTAGPRVLNAALVNQGTLTIDQGAILNGSVMNSGTIAVHSDDLTVNLTDPTTPFINTGTINVSPLRSLILESGDFANSGTVSLAGFGGLVVPGTYTQTAGSTQLTNGLLVAGLVDLEGGSVAGTGIIDANVLNNAVINVGQSGSPGVLTIAGDYTQTSGGVLVIEIDGRTPGVTFDQLNITGQATLDGTLTVINGFQPDSGDSFQIMTFGSRSGTFATINGDGPSFEARYNDTDLNLVAN